jgi:hypothetical protein
MPRRLLALALVAGVLVPPALAAAACTATAEAAVDRMGSLEDELVRVGQLAGAVPPSAGLLRRGGPRREPVCDVSATPFEPLARRVVPRGDGSVDVAALPLRLGTVWNSRYPSGTDDGLLWAGRGVSQLATGGATLRWGMLSATIAPEVSWSENRALELPAAPPGGSPFANPYYPGDIDLPQRFGAGSFATWGPGQSSLRLERWNLALGLSTESLWMGAGIRDSILLTDTGPGFPHLHLGTARPFDTFLGGIEALLFWGRLERTEYKAGGGHPLLIGLGVTYSPRWVPGLHLGLGRLMTQPWDGLRFRDYFAFFQSFQKSSLKAWYGPTGDNPYDNQIAAVFGRWVFPEVGFEVYGEWAREDHDWTAYGTIREPDHSQAYLIGLHKVFRVRGGLLRYYAELTHLQEQRPLGNARGVPVYYVHAADLDLTNRGQLLGAWIGPGGDSQTMALDYYHRGGRVGGYLERVRRNDAYYWAVVEPVQGAGEHDVEVIGGLRQALALGPLEVSWDASVAYRWNRDFLRDEANVRLMLELALPLGRGSTRPAPPP